MQEMNENKVEKIDYEKTMAELETLVRKMESGEMGIDSMVESIGKAKELIKLCKDKLMKTEEEIRNLTTL